MTFYQNLSRLPNYISELCDASKSSALMLSHEAMSDRAVAEHSISIALNERYMRC